MKSMYTVGGPGSGLVDWLRKPARGSLRHSIVLGSRCNADLPRLGAQLARTLNTATRSGASSWQAFSIHDLWHLAGDPEHRDLILGGLPPDRHPGPPDSDIDRIARRLARIGGAILEGQYALDATEGLANTFRVCLCSGGHRCPEHCDALLDISETGDKDELATVISSAFLNWRQSRPPAGPRSR